jgi:hypothetical protein
LRHSENFFSPQSAVTSKAATFDLKVRHHFSSGQWCLLRVVLRLAITRETLNAVVFGQIRYHIFLALLSTSCT